MKKAVIFLSFLLFAVFCFSAEANSKIDINKKLGRSSFISPVSFLKVKNAYYFIDKETGKVFIETKDGSLISTFGGKGQGPGKFLFPFQLILGENKIGVFDGMLKSIRWFSLKGKYLNDTRFNLSFSNLVFKIENNDLYYACLIQNVSGSPDKGLNVIQKINLYDKSGKLIKNVWKSPALSMKKLKGNVLNFIRFFALTQDNTLYISDYQNNAVIFNLFNQKGERTGRLEKEYSLIKLTKSEKEAAKKRFEEVKKKNPMAAKMLEGTKIPEYKTPILGIEKQGNTVYILYFKRQDGKEKPQYFVDIVNGTKVAKSVQISPDGNISDFQIDSNDIILLVEKDDNYFVEAFSLK